MKKVLCQRHWFAYIFIICNSYQHGGSQIVFVKELCDEDVDVQDVGDVFLFHFSEDVDEPLKIAVGGTDPQEVDLFTGNAGVTIGGGTKDQIVEDGGVGGHPDAPAHHDGHLELVPVLVAAAERTFNADLGRVVFVLLLIVDGLVKAVK